MFQESWQDLLWFYLRLIHGFCGSRTGEAASQDVARTTMLIWLCVLQWQVVEGRASHLVAEELA